MRLRGTSTCSETKSASFSIQDPFGENGPPPGNTTDQSTPLSIQGGIPTRIVWNSAPRWRKRGIMSTIPYLVLTEARSVCRECDELAAVVTQDQGRVDTW